METVSADEVEYTRKSIAAHVRFDGRGLLTEREYSSAPYDIPMANTSIVLQRGLTKIIMSASFRSTDKTCVKLGIDVPSKGTVLGSKPISILLPDEYAKGSSADINLIHVLFAESPRFDFIMGDIKRVLNSHSLGITLEVKIVRDDGGIFDTILGGIHDLFSNISVPDVSNLSRMINVSLDIPRSRTFCTVGTELLADPTILELAASTGIIRVFVRTGSVLSLLTTGPVDDTSMSIIRDLFTT